MASHGVILDDRRWFVMGSGAHISEFTLKVL